MVAMSTSPNLRAHTNHKQQAASRRARPETWTRPTTLSREEANMSYPYKVDYNDHFETPLRAYEDILPLVDLVSPAARKVHAGKNNKAAGKNSKNKKRRRQASDSSAGCSPADIANNYARRTEHTLYDPYYCAGRAKTILESLGFASVVHEKRDFYADVQNDTVPKYDIFVTNPPYSGDHKERCIEYAVKNLRENGKPFFLLMPNYVALKEYYRDSTALASGKEADDIVYVVPPSPYEYDHPEGTGHEIPPFSSLWFCGVGKDIVGKCREEYSAAGGGGPRIACSVKELQAISAVKSGNRKNPKQRHKLKKMLAAATAAASGGGARNIGAGSPVDKSETSRPGKKQKTHNDARGIQPKHSGEDGSADQASFDPAKKKKKKSRHRDKSGVRTKKRF